MNRQMLSALGVPKAALSAEQTGSVQYPGAGPNIVEGKCGKYLSGMVVMVSFRESEEVINLYLNKVIQLNVRPGLLPHRSTFSEHS